MPTYRVKKDKDNPYIIVNKGFAYDPRLSWKAKGILLYFLSRPDDWVIREYEAIQHAACGRDAFRAGVRELVSAGYMRRVQARAQAGKFTATEYEIFESPCLVTQYLIQADSPSPGKPSTVKTKARCGLRGDKRPHKTCRLGYFNNDLERTGPSGEHLPEELERLKAAGGSANAQR